MHQTLPGLWYMMTNLFTKPGDIREKSSPQKVVQGQKRFDIPDPPRHGPSPPLGRQIFSAISLHSTLLQTNLITHVFQTCFLEYCSQRSSYLYVSSGLGKISPSPWNFPWISSWKKFPLSLSSFSNFLSHLAHSTW